ncbi:hypothetical protein COU13_00365 [Candidatus Kaiserbacteria bacterium CG10_big_fil_rev_8_21_14_0_10_43_70]|uniref:Uncharacterized protein n=1 Tax=Candidatus Kaiserbacteria bacterium CG10_big_fil_rev_8_21_14_0_10_43_70 TaxID=1974605 RepID=A0A2H0UJJ0_9BACT|nr:MAG: hypothetical protein COU13_00365 [Candidatus Kaiserbacteria bacterium CG10_big_fil_rev_8_21_14_0_10_43_70]
MIDDFPVIVLEGLEGNDVAHLKGLQVFLAPHTEALGVLWWVIYFAIFIFVLYKLFVFYWRRM